MKLSIFVTITNPIERQDPFYEAINCYMDLADEVVVINGSDKELNINSICGTYGQGKPEKLKFHYYKWYHDFKWKFIGQQFQRGYEACTGDWVIHADCDHFYHEKDMVIIRKLIEKYSEVPAISFYKKQFLLTDRYNVKSRMVTLVNKGKFGDRIRFDSGNDLCQPSLDGKEIKHGNTVFSGIPIWNYDFCFKTEEVIDKDWPRFDKAWKEYSGNPFGSFKDMMVGRFNGRSWEKVPLEKHPKYIQERIKNITKEQFGHSMFGWVKK